MSSKAQRATLRARMRAKLTVINGEGGPRVAKLQARRKRKKDEEEDELEAVKSESSSPLIVPLDRLRFRGKAELVKNPRMHTFGELRKKLPFSSLPLTASTHGPAPVWERQPTPDFADLYFQPESDERNKLRRAQQRNRKMANAARNAGIYSFHGEVHDGEPELRYDPETTLNVSATHGKAPGRRQKTALVVPKRMDTVARLAAGTADQGSTYKDDEDEDEDEKRKRKRRFVLRRTTRRDR